MKAVVGSLALTGCGLLALPASAATIYIGLQPTSGPLAEIVQVASGAASAGATYGSTTTMSGPFIIRTVDSSDAGSVKAPIFLSSLNIMKTTAGAATITVWVTETGLTGGALTTFMSTLTSTFLSPGWTVDETTYYTAGNELWGTGVQLLSQDFASSDDMRKNTKDICCTANPYSLTEKFVISETMPGQARLAERITATLIPEAPTWAMMAIGFAGLSYAAFRRSVKSRVVARAA